MNITEIIAAERWEHEANRIQHNASLDRILEALEKTAQRQAERIEYLDAKLKVKTDYIQYLLDKLALARATVTPVKGACTCGAYCINNYGIEDPFCRKCGAKLNWDAE